MQRYKMTVEYCGARYAGFQRQPGLRTIQGDIEAVLHTLYGGNPEVWAAGRTDAGVHARGQVIHVDLEPRYTPFRILQAINAHLRDSQIGILRVEEVSPDFHARFSAQKRRYLYRIMNRRGPLTIDKGMMWHVHKEIDVAAMEEGAKRFIGTHDFTSFRSSICQAASAVKTLDRLDITKIGDEIQVHVDARSFLHHQVRNLVGTLVYVGTGKWKPQKVQQVLEARDRRLAGPTAPAKGLYFMEVLYP